MTHFDETLTTPPIPSIRTTLILPRELWTNVKIRAARERCSMRDIYVTALEAYLATPLPEEVR